MNGTVVLCRHPLSQFSYAAEKDPVWLLCHETKSQVRSVDSGVAPERIAVYPDYDRNSLVEYDAAGLIESAGIDRVVALSEVDVLRAAQLRDRFALPGPGTATALKFRDKVLMKQELAQAGVAVPRFLPVESGLELRAAREEYGFPFVVKPRLGGGSVGTRVLRNEAELRALLAEGLRGRFFLPAHLEAEEFVEGSVYQIDGLILGGRTRLRTVSWHRSEFLDFTAPAASRMIPQDGELASLLAAFAERVLEVLGLTGTGLNSYFHLEAFDTPDGPVLCEVAARPGGLGIVDLLDAYFGVRTFERYLDAELRGIVPTRDFEPGAALVGWMAVPRAAELAAIQAEVPAANRVGLRAYRTASPHAGPRISSVDFDGVVIVRADSEAELDDVLDRAEKRVLEAEGV
ncbi:MAG TPA: ATP-grasp domain-containing protein [Actinospica sp.]|jgi:formate-dependent phosphoribosylglycinamide formyltransferase (GAR transformylase)|nr:ATP-grasp domain-containing protein [Actinospica sp.]